MTEREPMPGSDATGAGAKRHLRRIRNDLVERAPGHGADPDGGPGGPDRARPASALPSRPGSVRRSGRDDADRPTLRSARLVLRPVGADDVPDLRRHWNRPAVGRYLWDDRPVAVETVAAVVSASDADFRAAGYGLWAVRLAAGGPLVGCCGLRRLESTELVEIVYSLDPEQWGGGLATEAGRVVLGFAFATLGLERVVGGVEEGNAASRRVLEKLGMRPIGPLAVAGRAVPYLAVTRDELVAPRLCTTGRPDTPNEGKETGR